MSETRSKSAKKPQDRKPAATDLVKVEYKGVEFEVKAGALASLRVLDLLERNQFTSALRAIVGDEGFERFLAEVPDAGVEDAGKILERVAEVTGAGN